MDRGWIKLHRKLLKSTIFQHEGMLKLWVLCLLLANHEEGEVIMPGLATPVKLKPGQFITGRSSLHYHYHQGFRKKYRPENRPSSKTITRWLDILENLRNLSIKKTNKFSIITICNWEAYQGFVQQVSNSCPTSVHKQECNKKIYSCEFFSVSHNQHEKYQQAYPNLDLVREYKKMAAWLESNPKKRKTPRGYPRFINNWLSKTDKEREDSSDWRGKLKQL